MAKDELQNNQELECAPGGGKTVGPDESIFSAVIRMWCMKANVGLNVEIQKIEEVLERDRGAFLW